MGVEGSGDLALLGACDTEVLELDHQFVVGRCGGRVGDGKGKVISCFLSQPLGPLMRHALQYDDEL